MSDKPRIAIFQAYWRLHSSTVYSVLELAKAGYCVDVFLFQFRPCYGGEVPRNMPNIAVHTFDDDVFVASRRGANDQRARRAYRNVLPVWVRRFVRNCYTEFRLRLLPRSNVLPPTVVDRTAEIMESWKYRALIGIEKGGLTWAGQIAERTRAPLIYSSLELLTYDDAPHCSVLFNRQLKATEAKYHKRCWATIIQDEPRARVLLEDNRVRNPMKLIYLPISRLGEPVRSSSQWLRTHLGLGDNTVIVLNYGVITKYRLYAELTQTAQKFPRNWKLVFHGYGETPDIQAIEENDVNGRVCLSLNQVPPSEEAEVVGSAHIGLALYKNTPLNDRLTAFSSEKIALYLQCGVPVIAFNYPGYDHIRDDGCGVLVKDIIEIPEAVEMILAGYESYRTNAFQAFEKYYRFETNFQNVIQALENLA